LPNSFLCPQHAFNYAEIQKALIANYQLDPLNVQQKRIALLKQFKQGSMPMRFYKNRVQQRLDALPKTPSNRDLLRNFINNLQRELQNAFKTTAVTMDIWSELADRCIRYEDLFFNTRPTMT
jgi:hypothetical protein